MKDSGKIVAEVLLKIEENISPGITTKELDRIASDYIIKNGAFPSFLGVPNYYGGIKFPGAICASLNERARSLMPSTAVPMPTTALV